MMEKKLLFLLFVVCCTFFACRKESSSFKKMEGTAYVSYDYGKNNTNTGLTKEIKNVVSNIWTTTIVLKEIE